jgi:hypothetical protein
MDEGFFFGHAMNGPTEVFLPDREYVFDFPEGPKPRFFYAEDVQHAPWFALARQADDRDFDARSVQQRRLLARNAGMLLTAPRPKRVFVWTPNGEAVGGTGHLIRQAEILEIPVFNFATPKTWERICAAIGRFR